MVNVALFGIVSRSEDDQDGTAAKEICCSCSPSHGLKVRLPMDPNYSRMKIEYDFTSTVFISWIMLLLLYMTARMYEQGFHKDLISAAG
jgi:hypothetical protein